jgi:hypothetical protein
MRKKLDDGADLRPGEIRALVDVVQAAWDDHVAGHNGTSPALVRAFNALTEAEGT